MIGQSAVKSYAYLLGVFLGDGSVTDNHYSQPTIDLDFAQAVCDAFKNLGAKPKLSYLAVPKGNPRNSPQWIIYCCDKTICTTLKGDSKAKQIIPPYVFTWDIELRKQFIIGLMDSEGFVAENHAHRGYEWKQTNRSYYMGYKSCDVWVEDLRKIMESVGLRLGKLGIEKPYKPHHKIPRRFHIKMQSWIDAGMRFNIARKQERVDAWGAIGPYERRALHPRGGPQRLCTIEGCGNKYLAKGLCNRHYKQAQAKLRDHMSDTET